MKKFLSLVLALVMTMSLVTVSAGAKTTYTDGGKIVYRDAVDVVSAAGIVDGYEDGSFNPQNTLTRGAAAKIICNMILGPTAASALSADTAPYSDVPSNHTFAGYIAYCQQQGIISGYSDGTFRPAGTLTGYAFMKMLLGALGYDAEIEKYVGPNWSIAVAKQALSEDVDLADGNDNFVGTKAVTREEACLYAFNTLKADMVEYENKSTITVGDIVISDKSKAKVVEDNNNKKGTYKKDEILQFCEKYFTKLTGKSTTDDFGRPATEWKYDGDKIGTYPESEDDIMVINKVLDGAAVLCSNSDYFGYSKGDFADSVDAYVNGVQETAVKGYSTLNKLEIKAGDQVEIYENDDDEIETVVVVRYELAIIDEVDDSLSSTYTKKGASYSITLESLDEDVSIGGTYYDSYENDSAKELPGFSADTDTEGTALAIAMKGNTVLDSHIAGSEEGKVTGYDAGSKANVTLDGTKYPLHSIITTSSDRETDAYGLKNSFNYDDSTYTIYTDKNGYVIGIDETESVKIEDVYYVTGIAKEDGKYSGTYYAQAVSLADGTITEFKLKESDSDTNKAFFGADAGTDAIEKAMKSQDGILESVAGLYTFDKDGSKYTVEQYVGKDAKNLTSYQTNDSTYYVYADGDRTPASIGGDLEKSDSNMKVGSKKVYLNDKTNYVKVENVGDDIEVKTVTGGTNVKQFSGDNETTAIAICTKSNNNYVASYVILVSESFSNTSGDDVVFVADTSEKTVSYKDADGKTQKGYQVDLYFMDGSGTVEEGVIITSDSNKGAGYYTYSINDGDVYELENHSYNAAAANAEDTVAETWTGEKNYDYDKETGYYKEAVLKSVYSNSLTVEGIKSGDHTFSLDDVDFASNVIIADDRGSATIDKDMYNSEITTVSQLKAAIDKKDNKVIADVFYDDGEVVMVYVWSMKKAATTDDKEGEKDTINLDAALTDALAEVADAEYQFAGDDLEGVSASLVRAAVKTAAEKAITDTDLTYTVSVSLSGYTAPSANGAADAQAVITVTVSDGKTSVKDSVTVDVYVDGMTE